MQLPRYPESKKIMNCICSLKVAKIIDFLDGKLQFSKHIVCSSAGFDARDYVEIVLEVPSVDNNDKDAMKECIVLDNNIMLFNV